MFMMVRTLVYPARRALLCGWGALLYYLYSHDVCKIDCLCIPYKLVSQVLFCKVCGPSPFYKRHKNTSTYTTRGPDAGRHSLEDYIRLMNQNKREKAPKTTI